MKNLFIFTVLILVLTSTSCARIGSPSGGLKDSIPPVMAIAKPMNKTTLFNEKKIIIYFDEYIKFKDLNTQLIISPPLKKKPIIKPEIGVSKKISIEFLENLTPNTTYTINFGNSIIDNNEGNQLSKFSYVFSTGEHLDSLKISGKIIDPIENKTVKNMSVLGYKNASDTLVGNYTPNYLTNTLDSCFFSLENLSKANYQLIALEDNNYNYKYDKGYEKIGFLNKPIDLKVDLDTVQMVLFYEAKPSKIFKPTQSKGHQIILGYQGKNIPNITVGGLEKNNFLISKEKEKDSLFLWFKNIPKDSIKLHIKTDTLNKKVTLKPRKFKTDTLLIRNLTKRILHPRDSVTIFSNIPIIEIKKDSIFLFENDSIPIPYKIINTPKNHLISLKFDRKRETQYTLQLKSSAFKDFLGNYNRPKDILFKTLDIEEYGEIVLNIKNPKKQPLIVNLINSKTQKTFTQFIENEYKTIAFKDIEPNEYDIRVIKDKNRNHLYDTGNFEQKIQPEKIINLKQKISLRANSLIIENILIN